MRRKARLVVLISGAGTNLQAIMDACQAGTLAAEVSAVVSNRQEAYGLERARSVGVPAEVLSAQKSMDRAVYDRHLAVLVDRFQPDWVVLAGWMRILTKGFLEHFPGRVVNLHPALPGAFPGTHAIERAWQAYQAGYMTETGVMVHLVPDEGIDNGPVLAQRVVAILPTDSLGTLEERIHAIEHELLVNALRMLVNSL